MSRRRVVDEPVIRCREDEVYRDEVIAHAERVWDVWQRIGRRLATDAELSDDEVTLAEADAQNHDASSLTLAEFGGERQWYHPVPGAVRSFPPHDAAVRHHVAANAHHPEYWPNGEVPAWAVVAWVVDLVAKAEAGGSPVAIAAANAPLSAKARALADRLIASLEERS